MNVVFLTSSTSERVFQEICQESPVLPNPSNQNFYHKVIKAVSFYENVEVVSHRPFTKGMVLPPVEDGDDDRVPYHYTQIKNNIFYKVFDEEREIVHKTMKILDSYLHKDCIIVVDVLRRNLLNAALKIKRKQRIPVIGVITDNPLNLSNAKTRLAESTIKKTAKLDGILALTDGLLNVFAVSDKPHYIFEGIVEDIPPFKKEPLGDYFAFAGSLYERYGVKTLIDAFKDNEYKKNLVVLGNGPLKNYIADLSQHNHRILYLSQLSKSKTYAIEQHAIANINPRPLNPMIDAQSIPSKMLEYLASGVPTISTKHPRLYDLFKNDVYWIEDCSIEGIRKAISDFMNVSSSEKNKKALSAKTKVYSMYGSLVQGEGISHFLNSFKTSKS